MPPAATRIKISLPERSYEAIISSGLLHQAGDRLRRLLGTGKSLFVITVPPVRRRWGKELTKSLSAAGFPAKILEMPDGERHKNIGTVEALAEKLTRLGAERNAVIL